MMNTNRCFVFICFALIIRLNDGKPINDKFFMDKMCGSEPIVLDGDSKPGTWLQLTNNNKYPPNFNCSVKFRAALPKQGLVITVEKMNIADCPGDFLYIYDGSTLLNKEMNQQCGTPSSFTFTTTTTTKITEVTFNFVSNGAIESSGFQIAIALHFPAVATCPQNLGFFLCKNKNCISKQLQCDNHNHCGDGTDEILCSMIGKK